MKYHSRRNRTRTPVLKKLGSVIATVVGFIMCLPFCWHMMFGAHEPYMSLWTLFGVLLVVVGGPTFFIGLITLFGHRQAGYTDTTQSDLARIRFASETQMMRDIMKDTKK